MPLYYIYHASIPLISPTVNTPLLASWFEPTGTELNSRWCCLCCRVGDGLLAVDAKFTFVTGRDTGWASGSREFIMAFVKNTTLTDFSFNINKYSKTTGILNARNKKYLSYKTNIDMFIHNSSLPGEINNVIKEYVLLQCY